MIPHSRPTFGSEEKRAVLAVLDSGQIAQGGKVCEFESVFARFTGRRYGVAVSSGTAALQLSLLALGISRGEEVILPSFSCAALLHAVQAVGARPVLADINLEDFSLSVSQVKKKIRQRTRAVIAPHLFGRAGSLGELADGRIFLIEDGTQALGARIGEKKVGSLGVLSVFSFYATKMIATGEGGMVLTDSRRLAEKLQDLRDYDKKEKHCFRTNSKMTDLEAAIGIEQMKKLPGFIERRREIASRYKSALQGTGAIPPGEDSHRDHVFYRYVIRVSQRSKEWLKCLESRAIEVKRPVYKSLHEYLGLSGRQFPATTQAMKETLSLPIYPSLSDEACEEVCAAIREKALSHVEV